MSEINQLVEQVKTATNLQINKQILREKILTDLHVPFNGGLFLVKPESIAFLQAWDSDELYLEDVHSNPIKVNRQELLKLFKEQYQKVMNAWHVQYESIKKIRKI